MESSGEECEAFQIESTAKAGAGQSHSRGNRNRDGKIRHCTDKSKNEYLMNAYRVPGSVLTALSAPEERPGLRDHSGPLPGHTAQNQI